MPPRPTARKDLAAGFRGETFKKGGRKKSLKQSLYDDFDVQGMKNLGTILRHDPRLLFQTKPSIAVTETQIKNKRAHANNLAALARANSASRKRKRKRAKSTNKR